MRARTLLLRRARRRAGRRGRGVVARANVQAVLEAIEPLRSRRPNSSWNPQPTASTRRVVEGKPRSGAESSAKPSAGAGASKITDMLIAVEVTAQLGVERVQEHTQLTPHCETPCALSTMFAVCFLFVWVFLAGTVVFITTQTCPKRQTERQHHERQRE